MLGSIAYEILFIMNDYSINQTRTSLNAIGDGLFEMKWPAIGGFFMIDARRLQLSNCLIVLLVKQHLMYHPTNIYTYADWH
jgi:hypothetical protein